MPDGSARTFLHASMTGAEEMSLSAAAHQCPIEAIDELLAKDTLTLVGALVSGATYVTVTNAYYRKVWARV